MLPALPGEFLLVLDHSDLVHVRPYYEDVAGLLRSWAEKSRDKAPWDRLRLVVSVSVHPAKLRTARYESPFANLSDPIQVGDLERARIADLARARGLSWTDTDTTLLMSQVGGHPYLVCAVLGDLSNRRYDLDTLASGAPLGRSHVADYLQRDRARLDAAPTLAPEAVNVVETPAQEN